MDQVLLEFIGAIVIAAVAFIIGWLVNNGYYSKVQGMFEAMCTTFDNFGEIIKSYDAQLYSEFKACIDTLNASFADNALTMAEFTAIYKTFIPLYKRVLAIIAMIGTKTK